MEIKKLTPKQQKAAWIVAAILLFIHFLPGMVHTVVQAMASSQHTAAPAKPSAAVPMPVAHPAVTQAPPADPQVRFLGVWEGTSYINDDQCRAHLEIRSSPDHPGAVSGFETRSCFSVPVFVSERRPGGLAEAMRDAAPVSTVLTGTAQGTDLTFHVDNTIGSSPFVCPLSSYIVSPFGQKSIVTQWRGVGCQSQMVLTRVVGQS